MKMILPSNSQEQLFNVGFIGFGHIHMLNCNILRYVGTTYALL